MQGWWRRSERRMEDSQCTDGGSPVTPRFPRRAFWSTLTATLLMLIISLSVTAQLWIWQPEPQSSLQAVRIIASDQTGGLVNQSAVVDKLNDVVTYSVTSQVNLSSTVLFDMKHGLICYKPHHYETCFLHNMEGDDYENLHSLIQECEQEVNQFWLMGNETQRHTEFWGVVGGTQVDASTLQEPLRALCQHSSIYWSRKVEGPGKQRLIYFCIDICFPSNICVSVCFYYLPE